MRDTMGIISDSHDFAFFRCLSNFIYWYTEACFTKINIKPSWLWDGKVWVSWRRVIFTFVAFSMRLGNNWVCTVISGDCENIQMQEDRWHGVYMQMCCRCLHLIIERWHVQRLTPVDFYILVTCTLNAQAWKSASSHRLLSNRNMSKTSFMFLVRCIGGFY